MQYQIPKKAAVPLLLLSVFLGLAVVGFLKLAVTSDEEKMYAGTVTNLDPAGFVIIDSHGQATPIIVGQQTKIENGGTARQLPMVGQYVLISGTSVSNGSIEANNVRIFDHKQAK